MVTKSYIRKNLDDIHHLYHSSSSQRKKLFYSKLAILELCGWLEESMDDIAKRCCNRNIKEIKNRDKILDAIKRTYGFEYDRHFRKMLITIIGYKGIELIEKKADSLTFQKFKSTLGMLKGKRDAQAHTYVRGIMTTIDAPSVTLSKFQNLYEGLLEIDMILKALKY